MAPLAPATAPAPALPSPIRPSETREHPVTHISACSPAGRPARLRTVAVKTVRVSLIPSKVTTKQASPASS